MNAARSRTLTAVLALATAAWAACSSEDEPAPPGQPAGTGGRGGTGGGAPASTGGTGGGMSSGTGGTGGNAARPDARPSTPDRPADTGGAADRAPAEAGARPADAGRVGDAAPAGAFVVTAPWANGGAIPAMNSCMMNLFPRITWTDGPAGTQSYAFAFHDTANNFTHSMMVDIPAATRTLTPLPAGARPATGSRLTDTTWFGPCPPAGMPHTYILTIYALRVPAYTGAITNTGTVRTALEAANNADVLARTSVTGQGMRP